MLIAGYTDGPLMHCICAVAASTNASLFGAPADIIKTRAMNSTSPESYLEIVKDILRKEGVPAFFKGLDAVFFRLSFWNCIMFMTLEQIKLYFYDPTLDE